MTPEEMAERIIGALTETDPRWRRPSRTDLLVTHTDGDLVLAVLHDCRVLIAWGAYASGRTKCVTVGHGRHHEITQQTAVEVARAMAAYRTNKEEAYV